MGGRKVRRGKDGASWRVPWCHADDIKKVTLHEDNHAES